MLRSIVSTHVLSPITCEGNGKVVRAKTHAGKPLAIKGNNKPSTLDTSNVHKPTTLLTIKPTHLRTRIAHIETISA